MTKEELQSILDEHVGLISIKKENGALIMCNVEVKSIHAWSDEQKTMVSKLELRIEKTDKELISTI